MSGRRLAALGIAIFLVVAAPGNGTFVRADLAADFPSSVGAAADSAGPKDCSKTSVGFSPLSELKGGEYQGYKGGLYPQGKNRPPKKYRKFGRNKASNVRPRDQDGQPSLDGKIVLLSIGMSNTKGEFKVFQDIAESDKSVSDSVVIINGAEGGEDAEKIRDPDADYWNRVDKKVGGRRLTSEQVQVVWLKEAIARPDETFPDDAERLQGALTDIVDILRDRFDNLRLVYVSSRIYAGYATRKLNPEPYAYQGGFAVKWLIGKQIREAPRTRPWLAWGPYLWADGMVERKDGLVWKCEDLADDGTHPSESGKKKVARRLLRFLKRQPTTKSWFVD
jgi:hypothetical protein